MRQYDSGGSRVWSLIHPLPGVWSSGMVQEEREAAAGADDPGDLVDRTVHVVDVLEHEARDRGVERPVGERQLGRSGPNVRRPARPLARHRDLIPGGVDADRVRAGGRHHPADLTVAAADVEQPVETGQFRSRQRQDLLLVLGIGTGGEAVDPPGSVFLPQVVAHRGEATVGAMKFSVWPNSSRPVSEILELARLADTEGWHGLWYADHYMPNTGSEEFAPGDMHECWAMLPAVAAVTERVRLGSLVAPTSVHHPAVLANRAATIDHISNGRLVLGIGAGWQINEHHAYGIELEPPATRVDRFEEAIQIVRSLFENERTTFEGTHYTILDAPMDPKPVQAPLPILVGTASPRMLRITATHADEWNTWGAPELAGAGVTKFLAACERVGRDPATMRKCAQALVIVTDDADAWRRRAPAGWRRARSSDRSIRSSRRSAATSTWGSTSSSSPTGRSPPISTPVTVSSSSSSPPSPPPTADRHPSFNPRLRQDF